MSQTYEQAKQIYAAVGVDTDAAIKTLQSTRISMHCWQGDDVTGFENALGASGGIQVTGKYPGKATTPDELMADIKKALSFIPGNHRINLHAIYAVSEQKVERNLLEPCHFQAWIDFAKANNLKLDMNPTLFSHPMAADGLTLSHPDEKVRRFWIEHCIATRKIAEYMGRELGDTCLHNIWIPDGLKDVPADRIGPRARLKASLDEIYAVKLDKKYIADSVESKVFGIGVEAYTVGSHEFYMNYAAKNDVLCLLDNGHYHPTEMVSDKISSMLLFADKVALHVTRPVRWDSDHVVTLDDELKELCKELVRCGLDKIMIGLDFFDASINRLAAWAVGMRNTQKALLMALLMPNEMLKSAQDDMRYTDMLVYTEEMKSYPFAPIWEEFCSQSGIDAYDGWYTKIKAYEAEILKTRK